MTFEFIHIYIYILKSKPVSSESLPNLLHQKGELVRAPALQQCKHGESTCAMPMKLSCRDLGSQGASVSLHTKGFRV